MSSAYEQRILRLEATIQPFKDWIRQLRDQVAQLKQQQFSMSSGVGGGGGGGGPFFANHLGIGAATGTWPSLTPASTTGDVYKINGGGLVLAQAGATIYNAMPDATTSTKRQILERNGDGTYSVVGESCNNG